MHGEKTSLRDENVMLEHEPGATSFLDNLKDRLPMIIVSTIIVVIGVGTILSVLIINLVKRLKQ